MKTAKPGTSLRRSTQNAAAARPPAPPPGPVLLCVTGMSPAVLTETVWALAHEPEPVIPSRVVVITTLAGRAEIERQLFQPLPRFGGRSPWDALRDCLAAAGHDLDGRLRFGRTSDDLRVLTALDPRSQQSVELRDIRTPAENEAAADFLLEQVRMVVENPDTQLIASMAGGRKTMGALLYACLSLAGRETDRLTHVLVSEPFETLREFYFPGQPGGPLAGAVAPASPPKAPPASSPGFDPAAARVDLADVPFVPLRNLFVRELGRKAGSFSRLVESCRENVRQRAGETVRLCVETRHPRIEVNGATLTLAAAEQLLLLFLARRAKQGEPAFGSYKDATDSLNAFRQEQLAAIKDFGDWRHADSVRATWEERDIVRALSEIRRKLRQRGGDAALLAACLPARGRCSLELTPSLIHLKA